MAHRVEDLVVLLNGSNGVVFVEEFDPENLPKNVSQVNPQKGTFQKKFYREWDRPRQNIEEVEFSSIPKGEEILPSSVIGIYDRTNFGHIKRLVRAACSVARDFYKSDYMLDD